MGTLEELRESRDREATEGLESKMAKPAGFVRKEAQVQWLISKIPFITGAELSDPAEAVMRKTIMIGDSRTDMMKDVVENDNITWICEIGMGYKWFRDTALKTLQKQMKGNEDIFVWLGVNDVYNISNYISLLNEEIPKWKAQGADVYIVAVGQVTKDPYVTNEEIEDFNARMKKEVAGAKYADLYSYLKKQGYKTTDGTHYDNETTWKIYRYLMSFVS